MNMSNKAVRCEASAASCEYSVRYGGSAKHGAMPAYCHDSYAAGGRRGRLACIGLQTFGRATSMSKKVGRNEPDDLRILVSAVGVRSTEQRAAYIIIFIAAASLPPFSPLPEAAPVQ